MPEKPHAPALDLDALREIVAGTAAETGERFFDELVRHLTRAIGTKCAWVTEWIASTRRLRALAFWAGDRYIRDYEYAVAGTPCAAVVDHRRLFVVPDRVVDLYPTDPDLAPLGAVSYMGLPLVDTDGDLLGHLAVMHDAPLVADPRVAAVFEIFAGRAAAELRRLKRDRALVERERKLAGLVASAMDAIVELDDDFRVIGMNPAAERVFRTTSTERFGTSFDEFLAPGSRGKLTYLARDLARDARKASTWIPDGIDGLRADGTAFPAEATLSRFEIAARTFFTLILRDANERIEAEHRIRSLLDETELLRGALDAWHGFDEIVGRSPALARVLADVEAVAKSDATVLITGETGTGKELIARAIHRRSARAARPWVAVNCAAIAPSLQESELFGHERGAFTGATQRREGRFQLADRGTIFLDEVGETPLDLQAKLLRVLQEGELVPVGGSRTLRVDVRVIAATNKDLGAMVEAGTFRRDLLYRLDVFPLRVPPLRERGEDVVLLAEAFARHLARKSGQELAPLDPTDRARLLRYDWPGNVRELHNVIERAWITSTDGRRLNLARALPDIAPTARSSIEPPRETERILTAIELADLERANVLRALEASGFKVAGPGGAAERLGLKANTLASRMKALGIKRPSSRS